MRLNIFLSQSGYCSRRKADQLIKKGRVSVDGALINKPFHEISSSAIVSINGEPVSLKKNIYIIFHKPKQVVTTCYDKFAKKNIIDFLPGNLKGVFPVGRLDKDSSGLIVLTNDGQLCYRVTHPKFQIEKEYELVLNRGLTTKDSAKAINGILNSGDKLKVKKILILKKEPCKTICRVITCEGKKRHLRRLFNTLGYNVISLKRVRIGKLVLDKLLPGKYRLIEKEKIYHLLFSNQS